MTAPTLGNGLTLRRATPQDAEKLADFNSRIHSDEGWDKPDERLAAWTGDLLTRPHPTFQPQDFTIVEEDATGRIVSSLNIIPQTWLYEGIPFGVGRPELVGTLPEYRHLRLIQAQMDEIHRQSAARGEMVQAITGIPHYYKRFGYEMGLELSGGRVGFTPLFPTLKEGETEPYQIRPATQADIPFLSATYARAAARQMLQAQRTEEIWRYELEGKSSRSVIRNEYRVIQTPQGEPVGYLCHPWYNWDWGIPLYEFELKAGVSWLAVAPSVARYALQTSREYALRDSQPPEQKSAVAFWHGSSHPVYEVWKEKLPRIRQTYAWYVRVPDLPGFLRHIAPALEKRLQESLIPHYSGTLRLNLYQTGVQLTFENGNLTDASAYKPQPNDMGQVGLPDLTVLQLLFGYRSLEELKQSYADCYWETDEARLLTETIFPKKPSSVQGIT